MHPAAAGGLLFRSIECAARVPVRRNRGSFEKHRQRIALVDHRLQGNHRRPAEGRPGWQEHRKGRGYDAFFTLERSPDRVARAC
jgi:hypothetical protein